MSGSSHRALTTLQRRVVSSGHAHGPRRAGHSWINPQREAHHAAHHPDIARGGPHRHARARPTGSSPAASADLAAGAAGGYGQFAAGADRPAAGAQGAWRDPSRHDQASIRLQGVPVGARDQQRAGDDLGRQGHAVRVAAAWPATSTPSWTRAARARSRPSPRASTSPTAWPSRTARCTSPRSHRITKMEGIEDRLDNPPAMTVVYDMLPKRRAARLEVPGLRPRRQALLQHRRAVQHLHAARHPRQHLAHQSRRHRASSTGRTASATAWASTGIR